MCRKATKALQAQSATGLSVEEPPASQYVTNPRLVLNHSPLRSSTSRYSPIPYLTGVGCGVVPLLVPATSGITAACTPVETLQVFPERVVFNTLNVARPDILFDVLPSRIPAHDSLTLFSETVLFLPVEPHVLSR